MKIGILTQHNFQLLTRAVPSRMDKLSRQAQDFRIGGKYTYQEVVTILLWELHLGRPKGALLLPFLGLNCSRRMIKIQLKMLSKQKDYRMSI
jgi:hypothetical protein